MKSRLLKKKKNPILMGLPFLVFLLLNAITIEAAITGYVDQEDDVYSSADGAYTLEHPGIDIIGARRTGNEFKIWFKEDLNITLDGTDSTEISVVFSNKGEDELKESLNVWILMLKIDNTGLELTLINPDYQEETGLTSSVNENLLTLTIATSTVTLVSNAAYYAKCVGTISGARYTDWCPDGMSPYTPYVAFSPLPFMLVGVMVVIGVGGFFGLRYIQNNDINVNEKFSQLKGRVKIQRKSKEQQEPSSEA